MSAVEKIREWQETNQLSDFEAARILGVSELLYFRITHGEVTHPNIAKRIQEKLKLTDLETEELIPLNRRPHGGKYNPDEYVVGLKERPVVIPNQNRI